MNESLKFNCNVFKQLIDDNNNNSNIVLLLSPFNNENDYNKYLEGIKKGFKFIGCLDLICLQHVIIIYIKIIGINIIILNYVLDGLFVSNSEYLLTIILNSY